MKLFSTKVLLATLICVVFGLTALAQKGIIRGTITDQVSGEPMMFTNVTVQETNPPYGAETDLDGAYSFDIEPGTYSLEVSYVGYATSIIEEVVVKANEVTVVDFLLAEASETLAQVVVKAERIERSEVALLAIQKKALTIQDGLSAQEMSKFGASNAAESMKRVTGASVVDGKYIFVRGLGDRYSTAQLNGMKLASTDPYRNSVQMDLIPANLLDNIIASKTFTADQPGDFTGGNVDIKTKAFPERFTLSAGASVGYNTQSSFQDNFLTYQGGNLDWLGFDDGTRAVPTVVSENRDRLTRGLFTSARNPDNIDDRQLLDETARALNPQMEATPMTSGLNHSFNFSVGNQKQVGGNPLGYQFGMNYSRDYAFYDDGVFTNYEQLLSSDQLLPDRDLTMQSSTENPVLGAMAGLSYKFGGSNKISFLSLFNNNTTKGSSFQQGIFPAILSGGDDFQTRGLIWRQRFMSSNMLMGEHALGGTGRMKLEWGLNYVNSGQNEPGLRFFANEYLPSADDYNISPSEYNLPLHVWRELQDEQLGGKVDFTLPLGDSQVSKLKFGAALHHKSRNFFEDRYQYEINSNTNPNPSYDGNPEEFFGAGNVGVLSNELVNNRVPIGLYITDRSLEANTYTGTEQVAAVYGMGVQEFGKLKVIAGLRVEQTDMNVNNQTVNQLRSEIDNQGNPLDQSQVAAENGWDLDSLQAIGNISQLDFLPALNLIFALNEDMNLRFSATQTLARPNLRELAPFSSFEFFGDFIYTGNPDLNRALIQNYDLRWEWYPRPGEVFAVSPYYKNFNQAIVQAFNIVPQDPNVVFVNVDQAQVFGIEFEARKKLDFISPALSNFKISTNVSFIRSTVDIPVEEREAIETFNPDKGFTRPFQGQSPFIANAALVYSNPDSGWESTLAFNVFGTRLAFTRPGQNPDVYEKPRPSLDFNVRKAITEKFGIRISGGNLLNPSYRTVMRYRGEEFTVTEFKIGRTFSFGLSYQI